MIKFLAIPLLCSCISVPSMNSYKEENHYLTPVRECVSFDDEGYNAIFNVDELNGYQFTNLANYINSEYYNGVYNTSYMDYVEYTYDVDEAVLNEYIRYFYAEGSNTYIIEFSLDENHFYGEFGYIDSEGQYIQFDHQLTWTISQNFYAGFKQAIELDIQANQTSVMPNISDLFQQVTSAITAFVGSMGQAFTSITALFWTTGENPGPTFLGLLVLIGVGVGLVYGAYRVIKGLLHRI